MNDSESNNYKHQSDSNQPEIFSAPVTSILADRASNVVNFVFHGSFSFCLDERRRSIKVAAPVCHEHCYAIRVVTPLSIGPSCPAWASPVLFIPHGFISVTFHKVPTSCGLPPRENLLFLPGQERATDRWSFCGNEYFCMDLPFPAEFGSCRTATEEFFNSGADLPSDAKGRRKFAVVHRFTYDVRPSEVQVRLPFPYGQDFDLLAGQTFPSLTYHFYAEPLFSAHHNVAGAFDSLIQMLNPRPRLNIKPGVDPTADPPKSCSGLSADDQVDLGEFLGVPSLARHKHQGAGEEQPMSAELFVNAKLRNCLSVYIQTE